jgi:hypothetical protein
MRPLPLAAVEELALQIAGSEIVLDADAKI